MAISLAELQRIEARVLKNYKTVVVDAFVVDSSNSKLLLQKRSADRRLFPNMWDPLGGHLENNENFFECLNREIKEESNMNLSEIIALVNEFEWSEDRSVVNLQFLCRAQGVPAPELGKVTEVRWISEADLSEIEDSLTDAIRGGVKKAFAMLKTFG